MRSFGQRIAGWWLTTLFFLLPLKFGTLGTMPEQPPMFPEDLLTLLVISWPPHFAGVIGALLLGASVLLFPAPRWRSPGGLTALFWGILLPLAALPGILSGTNADYVSVNVAHWFGIGAFVLSAWWIFSAAPCWKKMALHALAAGVLVTGIDAWRQYFWGFEEMQEMIRRQREAGIDISPVMEIRIMDSRVFASLGSCNTYAGFLLLGIPLTLAVVQSWAKRFEPVRVSLVLFTAAAGGLLIPALLMTRSRGAWLCAFGTAVLFFFFKVKVKKIYKAVTLAAALFLLAGAFIVMQRSGRGLLSGAERLDYLRSSAIICSEHPLAGAGWGEFFHRHMQLKRSSSDEAARSPHNFVANFAVHAGLFSGLIALGALAVLLFELFRAKEEDAVLRWGRLGAAAFLLHSLMELNDAIPASMICCAAGALALLPASQEELEPSASAGTGYLRGAAVAGALLIGVAGFYTNLRWLQSEAAFEELELTLRPRNPEGGGMAPEPLKVMRLLDRFCQLRPGSPYGLEMAGDFFLHTGDIDNAEKLFKRSLELVPARPAAHRRMALVACHKGNMDLARKHLAVARSLFPADPKNQEKDFFERWERSGSK